MKVLVIPDVHLKPWMFQRASELMKEIKADRAVCLMDIADDWRQQFNLDLYIQTYDMAIDFAKEYPETLWCYGNHDVCYLWNQRETGYSKIAPWTVCEKLRILRESLSDERQLAYLHRIDKVLFSHGGLADDFVRRYYEGRLYKPRKLLQVVGHTPVEGITRKGNFISCDVFSTDSVGTPIGTQEFMVIDTVAWDYQSIR